jgi:hypothetical protein
LPASLRRADGSRDQARYPIALPAWLRFVYGSRDPGACGSVLAT